MAIDRETRAVSLAVLDVVEEQVEIAALMDANLIADALLHFGNAFLDQVVVELVLEIGVRSGDDVGSTGLGGQFQHGERVFNRLSAVVDAKHYVAMDINQFASTNLQQSARVRFQGRTRKKRPATALT